MNEDDLQALRRARLVVWLKANGGAHNVCERRGLKKSVESRISQFINGDVFGQRAARSMEAKLGMDSGYLDDTGQSSILSGLSPLAIELARSFDELTDQRDRIEVLAVATDAMRRILRPRNAPPTDAPVKSLTPEKRRAKHPA